MRHIPAENTALPVKFRKSASFTARPAHATPMPQTASQFPQPSNTDQRVMGVKAAARYLSVSPWQIRKWKYEGLLKAFRYPGVQKPKDFFEKADLDEFVERAKAAASN